MWWLIDWRPEECDPWAFEWIDNFGDWYVNMLVQNNNNNDVVMDIICMMTMKWCYDDEKMLSWIIHAWWWWIDVVKCAICIMMLWWMLYAWWWWCNDVVMHATCIMMLRCICCMLNVLRNVMTIVMLFQKIDDLRCQPDEVGLWCGHFNLTGWRGLYAIRCLGHGHLCIDVSYYIKMMFYE